MRTRIKVVEYNSGKKDFICQQYDKKNVYYLLHPVVTVLFLLGKYNPFWTTMEKYSTTFKISTEDAIFDTMENATAFINIEILRFKDKKEIDKIIQ